MLGPVAPGPSSSNTAAPYRIGDLAYVFCPYTMVKDHRTRFSVGNIQAVMDGDLDDFMNAYLVAKWKGLPMDGSGDDDDEV